MSEEAARVELIICGGIELAVGNIVRKVLRLIREEYRAACLSQLQQSSAASFIAEGSGTVTSPFELSLPPSTADTTTSTSSSGGSGKNNKAVGNESVPGTPMPPTPGIHVPSGHFLSDEYSRSSGTGTGKSAASNPINKPQYFDRPTRNTQSPPPINNLTSPPSAPQTPISQSHSQHQRSVSGPSTPSIPAVTPPSPAGPKILVVDPARSS